MTISGYQDILWNFVPEDEQEERYVLRIFSSEEELFATACEKRPVSGLPVALPFKEFRNSERSATRGTQSSIRADLFEWVGKQLWQGLPAEARELFQKPPSLGEPPIRIKISSDSTRITDIPWEWLCSDHGAIALRPNVRLTRSVPVPLKIPELTVPLPVRVLLVVTNPKDERLLNSWAEIEAIRQALMLPDYDVRILERATLESLREVLASSPHILHYVGHAGINHGEGNIILHDQQDGTSWVSAAMLAEILPPTVRLVCLSTCLTAPNYQLMGLPRLSHARSSVKLPTMVVNQHPVQEQSVRVFWKNFYDDLLQSAGNVNEAVHIARAAAFNNGANLSDWGSFVMVIRDRTGQSMRLGSPSYSKSLDDLKGLELQAQFASQMVNELAEQTRLMGKDAPEVLRNLCKREAERAAILTRKLI